MKKSPLVSIEFFVVNWTQRAQKLDDAWSCGSSIISNSTCHFLAPEKTTTTSKAKKLITHIYKFIFHVQEISNSILEVILRGTFYSLFLIYTSLQIAQGPFVCLFKFFFFWLKTFLSYAFYDHFKGKEGETFSKGKRTEIIHEVGIVILFKRISSKDSRDYFTHWRRVVQPLLSWTHEIPWPFVRQTAFLASELEWEEGLGCNSEFTREKWK